MKGQTEKHPFGFIRVFNTKSGGKTIELASIQLRLYILALNFEEFLNLMKTFNNYARYGLEPNQYEKMRWKHQLDSYLEVLPAYYNDFFNTCLRFVDQQEKNRRGTQTKNDAAIVDIILPSCDTIYRKDNRALNENFK